jgi:shikimate dehydrogenase
MSESKQSRPSAAFETDEPEARPQHENNISQRERPEPSRAEAAPEIGGPAGPEPTRYGDWERKGRCIDF